MGWRRPNDLVDMQKSDLKMSTNTPRIRARSISSVTSTSGAGLESFTWGSGPETVVLFHGAASHSGQWRTLIQSLCSTTELIAINQYGYGNSPPWPNDQQMTLFDQANAAFTILNQHRSFHLVGHSHGASIAAVFASMYPKYIKSLNLYEPNTFGILDRTNEAENTAYHETFQAFQGAISHSGSHEELAESLIE